MGVKALGYVIVESAQPARWDHFMTQVVGAMRAPDAPDGALQFRQGMILYTLQGDPRVRSESQWQDNDAGSTGPISFE